MVIHYNLITRIAHCSKATLYSGECIAEILKVGEKYNRLFAIGQTVTIR